METKTENANLGVATKSKLFLATFVGIALILTPIGVAYVDPVMHYAKYRFRLDNGTILHEILQRPFQSLKVYVYLFNVTNAEEFLGGTDAKVKLHEVGPFVYQEIRTNEDIVINQKPGIMWLTPKTRPVFLPEESICDPKDIVLTLPNFPLLYISSFMGKRPYLLQQLFNYIVVMSKSKLFNKIRAYDALWDTEDPLIALANKMLPGFVYFKSFGLLSRLYDFEYDYRLEVGTTDSEKFAVKQSIRSKPKDKPDSKTYVEKSLILPNNTYEGAIFPQNLSPDQIINIYRPSVCRTFQFNYTNSRPMFYGGDAFVYKLPESSLNDHQNCFTNGWCPSGLLNLAPCYWGLPAVLSKGHFLDADPRLLDLMEGFRPNRSKHDGELVIDPKVGVAVTASLSVQISVFISNTQYNPQTKRLQNTVMPTVHYTMKSPPLIEEALNAINFVYKDGPHISLITQICCGLLGLSLLTYSARHLYLNWLVINNANNLKIGGFSSIPLMLDHKKTNLSTGSPNDNEGL